MIFSVVALQRWLVVVAGLRSLSVVLGFFFPDQIKTKVITRRQDLANPLFARLFATWTTVTCFLCVGTAYNPKEKGLYIVTACSFLVAIGFFLNEVFVHKTIGFKGAVSPMIIAVISAGWMITGYDTYVNGGSATGSPKIEL